MRLSLLVTVSLALAALPALGQESPQSPATLPAPRWRVGDSWLIATYAREPKPAGPGSAPLARPLRGLDPLRAGVPRGWVEVARWRLRVERQAPLRHPEDPRGAAPIRCWVLSARRASGEGGPVELWFGEGALRLLRVVERAAGSPPRETWLGGALTYAPRLAARLGLPLAWPDWSAGPAEREVELPGGERLTQSREPTTVTLSRRGVTLLRMRLGPKQPWWLEVRGRDQRAQLLSEEGTRGRDD